MGTPTGDIVRLLPLTISTAGCVNKAIIRLKELSQFGRAHNVVNILCQSNNKAIIFKFIHGLILIKKFSRNYF